MQKPDKKKWPTCENCGDKIPPGLRLYRICVECLTSNKNERK